MKDLEADLATLPEGGGPPDGWQERVLAKVSAPPSPPAAVARPRPSLFLAGVLGTGLLAAAGFLLLVMSRQPSADEPPPMMEAVGPDDAPAVEDDLRKLQEEKDVEFERLLAADNEADRAAAQAALEAKTNEIRAKTQALRDLQGKEGAARRGGGSNSQPSIVAKCDPNDPLCGI